MPCAVLAGQHARGPAATTAADRARSAAAAGSDLALDAALQQGVLHLGRTIRARPARALQAGRRRALSASRSSWRCRRTARARCAPPRRRRTASPPAGSADPRRCSCHRSTWSMPEPVQRRVEGPQQVARGWRRTGARCRAGHTGLRRHDHRRRGPHRSRAGADDLLGPAVAVDVRGVDEGAAGVDERLSWSRRLVLVGVPAPGHRAQAQPGDLQAAAAERRCSMGRDPTAAGASAARRGAWTAPARRHRRPAWVSVRRGRERDQEAAGMQLGLNLGYWGAGNDADNLALAQEADRLGYAVVWAAEAYGSDAATVLAWVAAQTERIDVGSAVFQIPGRTPAHDRDDRGHPGHPVRRPVPARPGVSGPQVSEGWHGVRFDKPLARTREYVGDRPHGAAPRDRSADDGRVLHAAAAGRAREGAAAHRAPGARRTSRSTWPRSARRTSSWPARSPTAGWPIFLRPSTPASAGARASRRARPPADAGRLRRGADRAGRRRRRRRGVRRPAARLRRALRRRHGQPRAELLQPARGADGVRARRPARCRSATSPATTPARRAAVPLEFIDQTSLHRAGGPHRGPAAGLRRRRASTTLSVATYAATLDERLAHPADHGRGARRVRAGVLSVIAWFEAIVLGIVQGLTEFLPISSTATCASCRRSPAGTTRAPRSPR